MWMWRAWRAPLCGTEPAPLRGRGSARDGGCVPNIAPIRPPSLGKGCAARSRTGVRRFETNRLPLFGGHKEAGRLTCFFAECIAVVQRFETRLWWRRLAALPQKSGEPGRISAPPEWRAQRWKRRDAHASLPYYRVMTVPALPASASTALSSEVMIARRPSLEEANFMAA